MKSHTHGPLVLPLDGRIVQHSEYLGAEPMFLEEDQASIFEPTARTPERVRGARFGVAVIVLATLAWVALWTAGMFLAYRAGQQREVICADGVEWFPTPGAYAGKSAMCGDTMVTVLD